MSSKEYIIQKCKQINFIPFVLQMVLEGIINLYEGRIISDHILNGFQTKKDVEHLLVEKKKNNLTEYANREIIPNYYILSGTIPESNIKPVILNWLVYPILCRIISSEHAIALSSEISDGRKKKEDVEKMLLDLRANQIEQMFIDFFSKNDSVKQSIYVDMSMLEQKDTEKSGIDILIAELTR
jgi:hypothetical protein